MATIGSPGGRVFAVTDAPSEGGRRHGGRVRRVLIFGLPFILYFFLSLAYFDRAKDWVRNLHGGEGDSITFVWFLYWWPFAIAHRLNPLITYYVWYPYGFNLAWATSEPSAAVLGWPLTMMFGPVFTFNLLSLIAPALSAWTAFLLAWYLTHRWFAAFVGGYLFGFSSYELGQLLGHPPVYLTFLVPLAVLLCLKRARGEVSRTVFVAGMTAVLVVELGLSIEIVATLCALGAITWFVFFLSGPTSHRLVLVRLAVDILLAALSTTVIAAPFLFYIIEGLPDVPQEINPSVTYSADLLNYIVPTVVTHLGRSVFADISSHFTGTTAEQGAYLGLPLILLLAFHFRDGIADRYTRALLITLGILVALSLGPRLQIAGVQTAVPLPWALALRLPLIGSALPARLTMYVALIASVTAALYLATPAAGSWRSWRFALAGLACVLLIPNVRMFGWSRWPAQPFFTPENVRQEIGQRANVLVLPLAPSSPSMAWQVNAGMQFTQAGGYVGFIPYSERDWTGLVTEFITGSTDARFGTELTAFCVAHRVNYILTGPSTAPPLIAAIAAEHWPQRVAQGVTVTQVPPSSQLTYNYITGDYWRSPATLNWMGQRATIYNHGAPALLTLSGQWRPLSEPVYVTLAYESNRFVYRITQSDSETVAIPPEATVELTASSTFVPDRVLHNGDSRALSVLISLAQE